MRRDNQATLNEDGLDAEVATGCLARLFHSIVGTEPPSDDDGLRPFAAVVRRANTLMGGEDVEFSHTARDLADMLRKAYAAAIDMEPKPFDQVSKVVAVAWEGVARLCVSMFAADKDGLSQLESAEAEIAEKMRAKLA